MVVVVSSIFGAFYNVHDRITKAEQAIDERIDAETNNRQAYDTVSAVDSTRNATEIQNLWREISKIEDQMQKVLLSDVGKTKPSGTKNEKP